MAFSHCFATLGERAAIRPRITPTIAPTGFAVASEMSTPTTTGTRNVMTEPTFTRGTFWGGRVETCGINSPAMMSFSLRTPVAQVLEHIVERKAERRSRGERSVRERV